jgi:SPP1 family predicted phage head-tail adaptor
MNAGRMDRRIQILEQQVTGRSASGARTVEWLPIMMPWAERMAPRGREFFSADQKVAEVECVYRIRYRDGVKPTQRVRDLRDGRLYEITAVTEPYGRRQALDLAAKGRAEAAA